jgi:DNA-binding MarR family transcriptional regulator
MGKKGKARSRRRAKHVDATGPGPDRGSVPSPVNAGLDGRHPATAAWSALDGRGSDASSAAGSIEIAAGLVSIGAQLQRQLGHGADDEGLTRARLSALGRLVLGGPCTLGQLAAREGVRPPTMTRLVHSMEAAGLVTRERHPSDGRSILIRATPAGEALLATGHATRLAPLAAAIAALDRQGQRDLEHASAVLGRFLRDVSGSRRRA